MKTTPVLLTLIVCLAGSCNLFANSRIKEAREHTLAMTQQALEKGTITQTVAEKIFELMQQLLELNSDNKTPSCGREYYSHPHTLQGFHESNICYERHSEDGEVHHICH